jgi:hypothetical protein
MDRQTLVYGSFAVYSAVFLLDSLLAALRGEVTLSVVGTAIASVFVLGASVYALVTPERDSVIADSRVTYLFVALAAVVVAITVSGWL